MARVLVIDDDLMLSRLLSEHLTLEGHEVTTYSMAEEGFAAAVKSPPDLIFVDVMLPDATGFQIVGRIREQPRLNGVRVIIMSGTARHDNQKEIGKTIMGADEYLVKPLDIDDVSEKVKALLSSKPTHRTKPIAASTPAVTPEPEPVPEPEEQTPAHTIELPNNSNGNFHIPLTAEVPEEAVEYESPSPEQDPAESPEPFRNREPVLAQEPMHIQEPLLAQEPMHTREHFNRREPVQAEVPQARSIFRRMDMRWTAGLVLTHAVIALGLGLEAKGTFAQVFRGGLAVIAGWALLLGILVAVCGALRILLAAEQAVCLLVWPAVPIVGRAFLALLGLKFDPQSLTPQLFWLRPLDIFEMAAFVILGVNLRLLPGSTLKKTFLATAIIALAWCLTNRGYFQP